MSYNWYYQQFPQSEPPTGSRATAYIFPGAICPSQCQFGRVHGTSPARGSVKFKGLIEVPAGQQFIIQIGQATYYGRAVKGELRYSTQEGNETELLMVDFRDRLFDVNHFAQYNMVDNEGSWWHILPDFWQDQQASYVHDLQDAEDFREDQEIQDDINLLHAAPPLLSAMTLLNYLSDVYNFTVSYSETAEDILRTSYPDNLDWNSGRRVIDAIQEICERINLQFTAWGDLNIHITRRGTADNIFEQHLLAGTLNLCDMQGFVEGSLGGEINEQGRRIRIVGGRNSYEYWVPCYPDWPNIWNWNLCNDIGYQLSGLLQANNLSIINRLRDLPLAYWDFRNLSGKPRLDMTIKDYLEQVPFKCYQCDFRVALRESITTEPNINRLFNYFDPENLYPQYGTDINDPSIEWRSFFWEDWYQEGINEQIWDGERNSVYPISANMPSDSQRQFLVKATSRKLNFKGMSDEKLFASGVFAWITEGANLDVEEYIEDNQLIPEKYAKKLYRVVVVFSERRFTGEATKDSQGNVSFEVTPDEIYCKLSTDEDIYQFTSGEELGSVRVREIVRNIPDLKKSYIDGTEVPLLVANYKNQNFDNNILADEVAQEIADRALNHETITVGGHMTFRTNAGFLPSGIIDNINVTFDAQRGTNESINFSNVNNDQRVPVFIPQIRKRSVKGEEELQRKSLQAEAKRLLREVNKNRQGMHIGKNAPESNFNRLDRALVFGGDKNAATVVVSTLDIQQMNNGILDGEVMVVVPRGVSTQPS